VDRDRACYIRANYGADWDLDQAYDLTLNTGSLAYGQVVEMLVEALAGKDRLASPEAKARLKDVALAYRLKARVATDPRVLVPTLEVNLEDGALVVSGIIHHPKELHRLQEIARRYAARDRCDSTCTIESEPDRWATVATGRVEARVHHAAPQERRRSSRIETIRRLSRVRQGI